MARAKKLPVILESDEKERLLSIPNPRYFTGERNIVLMELILGIGTRISETLDIKWNEVNLMTGKVFISEGKGKKDRVLWCPNEVLELLIHWRDRQFNKLGKVDYVFTTCQGKKVQVRYVQLMLHRITAKAKIEKNITPHTLRHTFATDFYRVTKDIRKTQKVLGHEDLSTTMIYTHIVDDDLMDSMKNFRSGEPKRIRKWISNYESA